MTVEMLVFVVVLLLVKYTLEFADRTSWRRRPSRRRVRPGRRAQTKVIEFLPQAQRRAPAAAASKPTGDPYWDFVAQRIAERGDD